MAHNIQVNCSINNQKYSGTLIEILTTAENDELTPTGIVLLAGNENDAVDGTFACVSMADLKKIDYLNQELN